MPLLVNHFRIKLNLRCSIVFWIYLLWVWMHMVIVYLWLCGIVVIIATAQLHSTKPTSQVNQPCQSRLGPNPTHGVIEFSCWESFLDWSQLKLRLSTFIGQTFQETIYHHCCHHCLHHNIFAKTVYNTLYIFPVKDCCNLSVW